MHGIEDSISKQPANARIRRASAIWALLVVMAALAAGCGYHIAGKGGKMPGGIKSVSIPIFFNSTAKPDIESTVTQAFVNEFVNTVHVTTDNEVVMRGTITSYELTPVSYTQNDVNQEYRLTVTLSLKDSYNNQDKKSVSISVTP